MEINLFVHEHPLTLKVLGGRSWCRVCSELILPWELAYECEKCKTPYLHQEYKFHKRCGELPREMQLPRHQHALILHNSDPYINIPGRHAVYAGNGHFVCDECGGVCGDFTYRCSLCEFNLDILCTIWEGEVGKLSQIEHFSHQHPLILNRNLKSRMPRGCSLCLRFISGRAIAYRCGRCEGFVLHKECAQLPREIMHPRHYKHPLIIVRNVHFGVKCSDCHSKMNGLIYYCSLCEFGLEVRCAMKDNYIVCPPEEERNIQRHKGHDPSDQQQHSLILQPRQALFLCDACGSEKKDHFYRCCSCPFMIHRSCASLPQTAKCAGHDCDLVLAYVFPSHYPDYRMFDYYCDICGQIIVYHYWVYYCDPCRHFVHLGCMKTTETCQIEANSNDGNKYDDLLQLPASDISQELIGRFLLKQNTYNTSQQVHEIQRPDHQQITHWGHKQHALILCHELPNEVEEDNEEILCNCCVEPILSSADYYCCAECSYFLHLSCAKLPKQLQHFSHPHTLNLDCHEKFYDIFFCEKCKHYSNGFFFKCHTCKFFYLDIKCAAMPNKIKHKSHKHPLIGPSNNEASCNACGEIAYGKHFNCESCEFSLDYECAMLPAAIRHSFDPHSLPLRFPPYKDHPQEFICDICENEMHPKRWLYHCPECDLTSFHTTCVPRFQARYQNVKDGGLIFQQGFHPHPLKFQKPTLKRHCDHCFINFSSWFSRAFECQDCNFCSCVKCIRKNVI